MRGSFNSLFCVWFAKPTHSNTYNYGHTHTIITVLNLNVLVAISNIIVSHDD